MNAAALLKLADLLDGDAADPDGIQYDSLDYGTVHDQDKLLSCETTACALGLAAISGEFADLGLGCIMHIFDMHNNVARICFTYRANRMKAIDAARLTFDLSIEDACYLFGGVVVDANGRRSSAAAERAHAAMVRCFVVNGGKR